MSIVSTLNASGYDASSGAMRPFPGHWYGPRLTGEFTQNYWNVYQYMSFAPIVVTGDISKVAFYIGTMSGTTDSMLTVALYNSNQYNWPHKLVWSAEVETVDQNTTYEVDVDVPIPDGLYWATLVSFSDSDIQPSTFYTYNAGYNPGGYAPYPSYGASAAYALNNVYGTGYNSNQGQVVIHATELGGNDLATVTELPNIITPGVHVDAEVYIPAIVVKAAE